MSSKRVVTTFVKYSELFSRCPKEQVMYLQQVNAKAKSYVEKINSLPEELPKIDWDFYKSKVRPEYVTMVEDFEKKYTEFQVPYPENVYEEEFEKMTEEVKQEICEYKAKSDARIEDYERKICYLQEMVPYDQMTMDDFVDAFPDEAPDFIKRPTFWPHTPDEQIKPMPPVPSEVDHKGSKEKELEMDST